MMQQHTGVKQFSVSFFLSPRLKTRESKFTAEVKNVQARSQNPGKSK